MPLQHLHAVDNLNREADHRIANSLAIISGLVRTRAGAADGAKDPKKFLLEIADRIETVAALHRLLAQSEADNVQIDTYLQQVCKKLTAALGSARCSFDVFCESNYGIPARIALPLGLITGELFSNSLKYAHPADLPTKVSITCENDADALIIAYEDDGVGFPEQFDVSRDGNLGFRFIHALVSQLGGAHKWSSDPLGIRFSVRVPHAISNSGQVSAQPLEAFVAEST